jgi:hypothetical protein
MDRHGMCRLVLALTLGLLSGCSVLTHFFGEMNAGGPVADLSSGRGRDGSLPPLDLSGVDLTGVDLTASGSCKLIDFATGTDGFKTKSGAAALGSAGDAWNCYNPTCPQTDASSTQVRWADGTLASSIVFSMTGATVGAGGAYSNGSNPKAGDVADPLTNGFYYWDSSNPNPTVQITGVSGTVDLLVYGHVSNASDISPPTYGISNSSYTVTVPTNGLGTLTTKPGDPSPSAAIAPNFTEAIHFVRFRGLKPTGTIAFVIGTGDQPTHILNGVQLLVCP